MSPQKGKKETHRLLGKRPTPAADLETDSIANARILLLVNYRPEYRHEWGSRTPGLASRRILRSRRSSRFQDSDICVPGHPPLTTCSGQEQRTRAMLSRLSSHWQCVFSLATIGSMIASPATAAAA
jgi:hypothetical protein